MKKVIIIGATGSLAAYVIKAIAQLKIAELTLFVRNKTRLASEDSKLHSIIEGDAMNFNSLTKAIDGQEIVYVNLAGDLEAMTTNIVNAMKEANIKRIIAISSIGIYDTPIKPVLIPYRKLADIIENSGLDYTIIRPDWFTQADEINYAVTHKGHAETGKPISRKSIASFVADLIKNPGLYNNENIGISKP